MRKIPNQEGRLTVQSQERRMIIRAHKQKFSQLDILEVAMRHLYIHASRTANSSNLLRTMEMMMPFFLVEPDLHLANFPVINTQHATFWPGAAQTAVPQQTHHTGYNNRRS